MTLRCLLCCLSLACGASEAPEEEPASEQWGPTPLARPCASQDDQGDDGFVDVDWRHLHDQRGMPARDEGRWHRPGAEGALVVERQHSWRRGDRLVGSWWSLDGDIYLAQAWAYDRGGLLIKEVADGEFSTESTRYEYDDDGRLIVDELDRGADGTIERRRTFEYEGDLAVSALIDDGGDDVIDGRWSFQYDERGLLVRLEQDQPIGGGLEYVETGSHDLEGRLILEEGDQGADGVIDHRQAWMYDEEGNLAEHTWDFDADGEDEAVYRYTYDAQGRQTELRASGHAPFRWTFDYDCQPY
jgi:YD repeat-containing protein